MLCSLHVFMKLPSLVPDHIGTKACPGLRSGIETSCHRIRHSRAGGNPRKAWVGEIRHHIHRPSNTTIRRGQGSASSRSTGDDRGEGDPRRARACLQPRASSHTGNPPHTTCRVPSREFPSLTPSFPPLIPSFPRRRESRRG